MSLVAVLVLSIILYLIFASQGVVWEGHPLALGVVALVLFFLFGVFFMFVVGPIVYLSWKALKNLWKKCVGKEDNNDAEDVPKKKVREQ